MDGVRDNERTSEKSQLKHLNEISEKCESKLEGSERMIGTTFVTSYVGVYLTSEEIRAEGRNAINWVSVFGKPYHPDDFWQKCEER